MCGIAALLAGADGEEERRSYVERMTDLLAHRGPDDGGAEIGPTWAVGMRRLAVQDPSNKGHQPMTRGSLTMVYNGEVYNYPELRSELERAGYTFTSGSDTEVVLHAFHRWGVAAFDRFNGMFALTIVDRERNLAWLARDRFGKKPLFVADVDGRVLVASELKSIMSVGRRLTLDRASLAQYFRYQYVPGTRSIFGEVQKLAAGSYMEIDLASGRVGDQRRYWTMPGVTAGPPATGQEVLDVVRRSVKRRLISDVPLGAFLSGGTDSSLVVACMAELSNDVRTFSIGFEDPDYDESHYAKAVAEHLETRHTHQVLTEREALDIVPSLPDHYDEPFADSSAIPTTAVSRLARRHVTVALSGDGGDELFGGYTRYGIAPYLAAAARLPTLSPLAGPVARLPGLGARAAHLLALTPYSSPGAVYRELVSLWRSPAIARLMPDVEVDDPFADRFDAQPGRPLERMMRTDAETYLVDAILQKVDRASMSVSLEARNPLLDPEVVEVGLRSVDIAATELAKKPLLRDALRLRIPDALVDRPKMGFGLPIGEWLRTDLRPMIEDLVLARRADEYDSDVAHAVCRDHLERRAEAAPAVWALLAYELWRARWRT